MPRTRPTPLVRPAAPIHQLLAVTGPDGATYWTARCRDLSCTYRDEAGIKRGWSGTLRASILLALADLEDHKADDARIDALLEADAATMTAATGPEVTVGDNGVTVTVEPVDLDVTPWQVTATDTETDETLLQLYAADRPQADTLRDNMLAADPSDLR